jgi:ABC-2 type transport system ATP-binding protein
VVDPNVVAETEKLLGEESYVSSTEVIDGTVRLYVDSSSAAIPHLMRTLLDNGIEPGTVEARRPSLDDVFLAKTGRSLQE